MYLMLHTVFGLACHIGVQLELPSVGIAKTLYHTDGIENNAEHHQKVCHLTINCLKQDPNAVNSHDTLMPVQQYVKEKSIIPKKQMQQNNALRLTILSIWALRYRGGISSYL